MTDRITEIQARCEEGRPIRRIDAKYLLAQLAEAQDEGGRAHNREDEAYAQLAESQRGEQAAVEAIRETCNHCGFNNKPCTETGCFAHKWREAGKGESNAEKI